MAQNYILPPVVLVLGWFVRRWTSNVQHVGLGSLFSSGVVIIYANGFNTEFILNSTENYM